MEFSSKYRKSKKRNKCYVQGCSSKMDKDSNLSFHRVPKSGVRFTRINFFGKTEIVDKRSEWLRKLQLQNVNKDLLYVCSKHFTPDDYYLPDVDAKCRILKNNAVPTFVNPSEICKNREAAKVKRKERCVRRNSKVNVKRKLSSKKKINKVKELSTDIRVDNEASEICEICEFVENSTVEMAQGISARSENVLTYNIDNPDKPSEPAYHDEDCELLQQESDILSTENEMQDTTNTVCDTFTVNNNFTDKSVQVNSDNFILTFPSFIESERDLITMCNIKSFSILDELTKVIDDTYPPKRKHLLCTRDRIILTTAKLKLDIPFSALAVFFKSVTVVTIRDNFYDTVKKLARVLECVIGRVTKEEIKRNMPTCFKKFQATTSVLDCTEVKIQTPKCLKCKIKFYSHYKSHLTVKFMTEVTPAGLITFVSDSFGGRASDKTIFNHSGILEHLESTRDAVMVDRGFLIGNECLQKRIKLIRPPFMKNKEQFTEAEAIENREIACARVHIERVNQRIKQFQILNHSFPWYMMNYVDDIFIISCALTNLNTPILADDKF